MLDKLFNFPIVMIDGDNEERKAQKKNSFDDILGKKDDDEEDYDMVYGEAEYPYWDFIGIEDRWLPSKTSLDKALTGKFDACIVRFANVGQLLVPWTKGKFKRELLKFSQDYELKNPQGPRVRVMTLTPDQFKNVTGEDGEAKE